MIVGHGLRQLHIRIPLVCVYFIRLEAWGHTQRRLGAACGTVVECQMPFTTDVFIQWNGIMEWNGGIVEWPHPLNVFCDNLYPLCLRQY